MRMIQPVVKHLKLLMEIFLFCQFTKYIKIFRKFRSNAEKASAFWAIFPLHANSSYDLTKELFLKKKHITVFKKAI